MANGRPGGGMGSSDESRYRNENFRDWGQGDDPMPSNVVFNPNSCKNDERNLPADLKALLDAAECRIKEGLKKAVFISKRPSFVEPPFFSKPLTKAKGVTVGPGAQAQIFDRVIEDRQRAVVATIGIDTNAPAVYNAQLLRFWFALDDATNSEAILPLFDDQTIGLPNIPSGFTTILPGTTEHPYSLLQNGAAFQVKGRHNLILQCQNTSGVAVDIRSVMSLYQYWLPHADEFASADLQL